MKQPLRLIDKDEPTKEMIFMAKLDQSWREWAGINGRPWTPFDEKRERAALDTDEILRRAEYVVIQDSPIPLWRRLLHRLRGL